MAYKVTILCMIAFLLLSSTLTYTTARLWLALTDVNPVEIQQQDVETENNKYQAVEGSCQGADEEECLMRRTLEAHLDYIYTQKENP